MCSWNHVFREANRVIDSFAKYSLSMDYSFKSFEDVPSFAYFHLLFDATCCISEGLLVL